MTRTKLILIVFGWVFLTFINFYLVNFFILAFEWLALIAVLFVISVNQLIKLIIERHSLRTIRVQTALVFTALFILFFFRSFTNQIIEKIDWIAFESRRASIVEQVLRNELNPNVSWNNWVCELPFEFPIVSNGGNDIGIVRTADGTTITFWVFRNFFDSPSTYLIYSNNPETLEQLEQRISELPSQNWKLKENWYRTYGSGIY